MSSRVELVRLLRNGVSGPGGTRPCLALAPIATVTHAGFRTLVAEHGGCDLFWTEMTSSEALVNGTPFESYYLENAPLPRRTIFQLVGYSSDAICDAAEIAVARGFAGVDINFACSAPHIVRKGGGIAWILRRDAALQLIARIRDRVPAVTLSVKLRLPTREPADLIPFCRDAADRGVDFVTLHPKLRKEGPLRRARWTAVTALRAGLDIPVIGSGGITGWDSLRERVRTGGDGPLMIGRGAVRAPWLFAYLDRKFRDTTYEHHVDLHDVLNRYHALLEAYQPEEFLATRARRFYPYFFSNYRFGTRVGAHLAQMKDYSAARAAAEQYVAEHGDESEYVETR